MQINNVIFKALYSVSYTADVFFVEFASPPKYNKINNQEHQHVAGRYEPASMLLSKRTVCPIFAQLYPSVKNEG